MHLFSFSQLSACCPPYIARRSPGEAPQPPASGHLRAGGHHKVHTNRSNLSWHEAGREHHDQCCRRLVGLLKACLFIVAVGVTVAAIVVVAGIVGISLSWLGIGVVCVLIARVFAYAWHDDKLNLPDQIDQCHYFDVSAPDSDDDEISNSTSDGGGTGCFGYMNCTHCTTRSDQS